jgi:hypothetical protein
MPGAIAADEGGFAKKPGCFPQGSGAQEIFFKGEELHPLMAQVAQRFGGGCMEVWGKANNDALQQFSQRQEGRDRSRYEGSQ